MKKGMVFGCVVLGLIMFLSSEVMASPLVDTYRAQVGLAQSATPGGKIAVGSLQ